MTVRGATKEDSKPLSESLARAFYDDPVFLHFLPDDSTRLKKLKRVMAILFKLGEPHGACYATDNIANPSRPVAARQTNGMCQIPWAYIVNGPALALTGRWRRRHRARALHRWYDGEGASAPRRTGICSRPSSTDPAFHVRKGYVAAWIMRVTVWPRSMRRAHALAQPEIEQGHRTSRSIRASASR